jgi:hypothetical protein
VRIRGIWGGDLQNADYRKKSSPTRVPGWVLTFWRRNPVPGREIG